jgi:hypothetical protein
MYSKIDIEAHTFSFDKRVCLAVSIYLKIPGYGPKIYIKLFKGYENRRHRKKELSFFSK